MGSGGVVKRLKSGCASNLLHSSADPQFFMRRLLVNSLVKCVGHNAVLSTPQSYDHRHRQDGVLYRVMYWYDLYYFAVQEESQKAKTPITIVGST